jgi:hypothetical protein
MKIENGNVIPETDEEKAALSAFVDKEKSGLIAKRDELLGKLKELDKLKDIDPDEYRKLKTQAEKTEEERAMKAGEFENLKKQLIEAHAKEKQAYEAKLATLHKSLEENVLIATATQAIAAEKGVAALLMPHVRSRTKLDDNGQAVVIDESGNVRVDAQGKPLPITALIAEMKSDVQTFGRAFEPSGASGAGSQSSNNNQSQQTNKSSLDKIRSGLEQMKR